jgi:hypothetical protein
MFGNGMQRRMFGPKTEELTWLTPLSTLPLEKLIVTQPVKKFPCFYGTQRFINVFTKAHHRFLSWARCIQLTLSHRWPLWLVQVDVSPMFLEPCLNGPSGLSHIDFPTFTGDMANSCSP